MLNYIELQELVKKYVEEKRVPKRNEGENDKLVEEGEFLLGVSAYDLYRLYIQIGDKETFLSLIKEMAKEAEALEKRLSENIDYTAIVPVLSRERSSIPFLDMYIRFHTVCMGKYVSKSLDVTERLGKAFSVNTALENLRNILPPIIEKDKSVGRVFCGLNGASYILDEPLLKEIYEIYGPYYVAFPSKEQFIFVGQSSPSASTIRKTITLASLEQSLLQGYSYLSEEVYFYDGELSLMRRKGRAKDEK